MDFPDEEALAIVDDPSRTESGSDKDTAMLEKLAAQMLVDRDHMLGFPVNLDFDYRMFADFLTVHANNVGSPVDDSEYYLHTKPFERAVVKFLGRLAGREDAFGYITNGGTEGNIFGCFIGRERFPDAVLYYSDMAHYSAPKIARLLRMESCSVATVTGEGMDLDCLRDRHRQLGDKRAAIVVATVGSTTDGSYDDIPGIRSALADVASNTHIHSDSAFGGLLAALGYETRPWAFESGADTVTISGHKMIGGPIPTGIVLAHPEHVDIIRNADVAVGADDDTISGSRDAVSPLMLWYELRRLGRVGLRRRVLHCLDTAAYAVERLAAEDLHPVRVGGTNTVIFDAPSEDICARWNLLIVGDKAHLITMPHVTGEHIDRLCADLRS